jgi:CO/xanthine dehydrogenase Mo-binding subunit
MEYIGQSVTRVDAPGKVKGETYYPGDITLPDQAYMKILFARRPHAIIKRIDTAKAEMMPGVLAVFTAKDVPVNEYGLIMDDQPVMCGPGSNLPFADRVRFIGDQVALVVAETEEIAAEAVNKIVVDYEDLPVVTSPVDAMQSDAVILHPERGSNVFCHYRIRKGDVENAFAGADVIVEDNYQTPAQEHAFLQPEAGISYVDSDGRVTVIVAGQWTHEDQAQIAHALGLPNEQIRVIYPAIGGAFGGREDMSVQIVLALAAWRLSQRGIHRPVKIIWSREESIIGHHKRHPYSIHSKWGATKAGKIVAAQVELIADGGGYAYTSTKVLGNATLLCTGPYDIPNVKVDAYAVYTNNVPTGAFRGFGGPQAAFSAELQINKLAELLGIDPVEMRMRNLLKEDSLLSVGTPLPKGVTMDKVLAKCAERAGWEQTPAGWQAKPRPGDKPLPPHILRGLGLGCGFKNVGFSFGAPEQSTATIELQGGTEIEKAILYHAGADVGQGAHTVFSQMAAEALQIPLEKVHLVVSDTLLTGDSGSSSASRMTFMAGNSIKGAAELALQKWKNEERPVTATYIYRPPKTTPFDPETGKSEPNFAYGYVAEAAEVEIDSETGQIRLVKMICVDDVGHAVNPKLVEGQIEGAVVQAEGYTFLENLIEKNGLVLTPTFSTYLIPTVLDVPDVVESVILEYPDPIGPWGARGMAEMPYLPFAPTIMAAVHNATGVWFNDFPLTPERVLKGLGKLEE